MQKNILIIDSCNMTRQAYKSFLSPQYALLFAETEQKGLCAISNNVRLVFLDMVLPDASGFEVLSTIKQHHPSIIPVVITTYDGSEEKCLAAFRGGARDYIKKPLRRGEIIQKTEKLMNITPLGQVRRYISSLIENDPAWNNQNIPQPIFESIRRVTDYILKNYASPFDLDDASKMALLSRSYFCYYFKLVTGHTFKSYISRIKMQKAMQLISEQRLSITETAQMLGYGDLSSLSFAFKRLIGTSPKQIKSADIH